MMKSGRNPSLTCPSFLASSTRAVSMYWRYVALFTWPMTSMSRNWTGRSMLNFNGNPSLFRGQPRTLSTYVCQRNAARSTYWLIGPKKKGIISGDYLLWVSWDWRGGSADREDCLNRCCDSQRLRWQNWSGGDS